MEAPWPRAHLHVPRRSIRWLAAALLPWAVAAWAAPGGPVRVGVYANPPKVSLDAAGRPSGIYVQVLEDTASRHGWRLEYLAGSFQQGMDRLERGEIDLMVDVARTPERARRYDFGSEVVLSSWNEVYAQPRLGIRYMAQLGGRRVAVLRGSVQEEAFRSTALAWGVQPVVEHFDTFEAAFAAAEAGRVDAVVANPFFAKRRGGAMSQTAIVFGSYALHYAATRGRHPDVLTALDRELARAKADPMSAYAREFESLVRTQRAATVPRWVPAAIAAVAVLLAVLLAWAASSRRATRRLAAAEAAQRQLAEQRRQLLEEACAREQRLRQANDDLHIVSQTLSHDLRAPLAAVHGFLSAVQERSAAALDGRAQHLLRRSMAAAQRMDGMVRDLGAMLRVAGQPLHLQRCDLTAMAQGVVDGLRIHQPGHPEVVIAPGLQGRADAQMLRVALENLVGNAWKFSSQAARPRIEFGRLADGRTYYVSDNGAGFAKADAGALFRPFTRLHGADEFPGTGMGLSIVHRIVTRHGGSIRAEGRPGEGATFYFTLAAG